MAALTHFVKTDITQRSTTSLTAVELTNYTVTWADLTGAGFAAGDDVLVGSRAKFRVALAILIRASAVGFGTTFAGRTEDVSSQWTVEPVAGDAAAQYQWFDRKTLVVNENIYFSASVLVAGTARYDELVYG